jgi:hypothetical protein
MSRRIRGYGNATLACQIGQMSKSAQNMGCSAPRIKLLANTILETGSGRDFTHWDETSEVFVMAEPGESARSKPGRIPAAGHAGRLLWIGGCFGSGQRNDADMNSRRFQYAT